MSWLPDTARRALKRGIDIVASASALVLGSPLLLACAIITWLDVRGAILFSQARSGLGGREFTIWKFRTMRLDATLELNADQSAKVVQGDERVTRFGRLLRETGLDELPQLWNVLRGDMSLVGPRPYMPVHTAMLDAWARRRLEVRPGLVCLAEVSGRNTIPWPRRLELDVYYVDHWSFWLDLVILVRTVPVVILRKDVYTKAPSQARSGEERSA